jgi:hypothetical protein
MKYKIARNSFYDPKVKRIDVLDNRFYFHEDNPKVFYPSTTTILEAYPKGWALTQWHKSVGFNADIILERAARVGTNVHDGCYKYVKGERLEFGKMVDGVFVANYTMEEWEMLCKFVEFWTTYNPKLIAAEVTILSDTMKLGGTIDLVFSLSNKDGQFENWILDTKSGNSIYPAHELQIAAYATMWNEQNPDYFISRAGILHLQALTRGADKKDQRIQGNGWQIKEFDRHYSDAYKVFKSLRVVWDNENPTYEPKIYSLPGVLELETPKVA